MHMSRSSLDMPNFLYLYEHSSECREFCGQFVKTASVSKETYNSIKRNLLQTWTRTDVPHSSKLPQFRGPSVLTRPHRFRNTSKCELRHACGIDMCTNISITRETHKHTHTHTHTHTKHTHTHTHTHTRLTGGDRHQQHARCMRDRGRGPIAWPHPANSRAALRSARCLEIAAVNPSLKREWPVAMGRRGMGFESLTRRQVASLCP
jgi:hypothetical protein